MDFFFFHSWHLFHGKLLFLYNFIWTIMRTSALSLILMLEFIVIKGAMVMHVERRVVNIVCSHAELLRMWE